MVEKGSDGGQSLRLAGRIVKLAQWNRRQSSCVFRRTFGLTRAEGQFPLDRLEVFGPLAG
jgi:hypothetical protein